MAEDLVLSLPQARRLAVRSQHLAGPPPRTGIDGTRQVVPRVDRRRGVLVVEGMFAEPALTGAEAPPDGSVAAAIESLASFAGAASVSRSGPVSFGVS
jgi:uncharacterized protein YcaQ